MKAIGKMAKLLTLRLQRTSRSAFAFMYCGDQLMQTIMPDKHDGNNVGRVEHNGIGEY